VQQRVEAAGAGRFRWLRQPRRAPNCTAGPAGGAGRPCFKQLARSRIIPHLARHGRLDSRNFAARHNVRFSNRPFGVKRFWLSTTGGVDVTRRLVLLSGIGT